MMYISRNYLLLIILVCFTFLFKCKSISIGSFEYKNYIEDQQKSIIIQELIDLKRYKEALSLIKKLNCKKFLCKSKYISLVKCYEGLNNKNKAEKYLGKAISCGFEFDNLFKQKQFFTVASRLKNIEKFQNKYLSKIDTSLRKQLFDIFFYNNLSKKKRYEFLDSLFQDRKWLGITSIGQNTQCSSLLRPKHVLNFLGNNDETNFSFYFPLIIKSCKSYDESWHEAECFMQMYFTHKSHSTYIDLPLIYIDESKRIKFEESFLQIAALINFINANKEVIEIYLTDSLNFKNSLKVLVELKEYIVNYGIDSNLVKINKKIIKQKEKSSSIFVFKCNMETINNGFLSSGIYSPVIQYDLNKIRKIYNIP